MSCHERELRQPFPTAPRPPYQPIRQVHHPTRPLGSPALLCMLNRMSHDPPFLVKFEKEQSAELLLPLARAGGIR